MVSALAHLAGGDGVLCRLSALFTVSRGGAWIAVLGVFGAAEFTAPGDELCVNGSCVTPRCGYQPVQLRYVVVGLLN